MTDWTYGDEAAQIHDLMDDMYYGREPDEEEGDFTRSYTIAGDPICSDCATCLHREAYYQEDEPEPPTGCCSECGGLL